MASRREREQRAIRQTNAARWAADQRLHQDPEAEARPSDYGIQTLAAHLQANTNTEEVYLYCRESTRKQDLRRQLKGARRRITDMALKVRRPFAEFGNGKSIDPGERRELFNALDAARRRGIPLVVPCFSRLLRDTDYHPYRAPTARPTKTKVEALLERVQGVPLLTLNDPDASPADDENFLRQLAAEVKRRKVGRPVKKAPGYTISQKERWLPRVLRMRARGLSLRAIADRIFATDGTRISHGTVRNWLSEPMVNRLASR